MSDLNNEGDSSFIFGEDGVEIDDPILGYNFRTYDGLLIFKRWDKTQKCENPYECWVDKDAVGQLDTSDKCGSHDVKLVYPLRGRGRINVTCYKGATDDEELLNHIRSL